MSFEVTVTPTVYDVEVAVNPSVQPFDVEVTVGNVPDLELTTNGDSGASTFDPLTGELNIPEYTLDGLGGVPESRTLTINGTTQDLSEDRTFTIPTHDAVTLGTENGLSLSGQVLSLGLASSGANGALSSTDWTTFNNKQNTITNPVTGTGASGQVGFWTGTGTQSGDGGLTWDNVNKRLGIGLTNPAQSLEVNGTSRFRSNIEVLNTIRILNVNSGGSIRFNTGGSITIANTSNIDYVRFDAGNVIIQNGGTFVDAGFRLDVNGTARVQGDFTISDTRNLILATGTGTKIGTATSQKLALWNATPIVQPTTAVAGATRVGGGGTTLTDTDTFDGYTLAQIVKALRNMGALA